MNLWPHLKQAIRGLFKKLILVGVAIFLFEILFAGLASSSHINVGMLKKMEDTPPAMMKMMGEGFMEAILKYGVITFGYIHPFLYLLFIVYIFFCFLQLLSGEIFSGSIGYTLSRPIARRTIFINLAIVVYGGLALLMLFPYLSTAIGLWLFYPGHLSIAPFISISWNLYLLAAFIAGYIALFASFADSGKKLFLYSGITLFVFYVADFARRLWPPLEIFSPVNPFSYYDPIRILTGQRVGFSQSLLVLCISGAMFLAAALIFQKKDLPNG